MANILLTLGQAVACQLIAMLTRGEPAQVSPGAPYLCTGPTGCMPACALHSTSSYPCARSPFLLPACLPAAAAHGGLCIFHVGSARRVATLVAHSKNLRGLAYDAHHNLLLTCSFDKTVKVWEAAPAEEAEAGH